MKYVMHCYLTKHVGCRFTQAIPSKLSGLSGVSLHDMLSKEQQGGEWRGERAHIAKIFRE